MSEFKFSCPHCDQHLQCTDRMSGKQIQCPACHHLIVIPASPQAQAQGNYAPESGKTWVTFIPRSPDKPAAPAPPAPVSEPPPAA